MFVRAQTLCLSLVFALCASAASVSVRNYGGSGTSCNANTGTQQCCNKLAKGSDPLVEELSGLLGIVLDPIDADVGLSCSPIVGNSGCEAQTVCCTGNTFDSLITIGCSPLDIGL